MYMGYPQARNGMGEIDWGSIIKDVTGGYVAVKTAQAAAKTAQTQAQTQALSPYGFPTASPGGTSFPYQYSPQ
jgi:hypothetical protein